jgi:peptide/nickel transport system permease protein
MSLIYIVIAVVLGSLAGYFSGWVDDLIQWLYQTLASIPGLLLLIALTFVIGKGLTNVAIALGVVGWVGLCRLMRAEYLKHKERDYVLAATALGASSYRIIFRHILPNTFHIVIISFSLGFVRAIMGEVVLTFLGLGAEASEPSWGRMISDSRAELARDPAVWWPIVGATAAMFVVCLAFNIFGDSLRDALDPKLKV